MLAVVSLLLYTMPRDKKISTFTDVSVKTLSVLVALALCVGSIYAFMGDDIIGAITRPDRVLITEDIVVLVRRYDPAQELQDAAGYTFGIVEGSGDLEQSLEQLDEKLGSDFHTMVHDVVADAAQALLNEQVDAMIYNSAFLDELEHIFEDFFYSVRVLYTITIENVIIIPPPEEESPPAPINIEPFAVFISGIDSEGGINTVGRSDTNLLIVVNPGTGQMLIITTPRDFWVEFPATGEFRGRRRDKLAHAGALRAGNTRGIDISMATMSQIYGIEIEHFIRVTMGSFVSLVDTMGGVEVYSERAFNAYGGVRVAQGMNNFNGWEALNFVRHRGFVDGDFQRGRNNAALINGVMRRAISPGFLLNPVAIRNVTNILPTAIETSFSSEDIEFLLQHQIGNRTSWNIQNMQALGTPAREPISAANPSITTSVILPNQTSINAIRTQIQVVMTGGILQGGEVLE